MLRQFLILVILTLVPVGTAMATPAPALNLRTASGAPGATVTVPVTLVNVPGTSISAVGMDIGYDTTRLESPNATIGPVGSAAGKSVIKNTPSPGVFRVGALGMTGNNAIADGVVINVTFTIKSGAGAGQITLTNAPSASDPSGNPVTVGGTDGTVTITSPRPALSLGTASGAAGATVTVPITLTNLPGTNISAVGMDIGYDTTRLENPNATIGPAGSAAGKSVIKSTPSTGVFRVGALSITDNNAIADGVVINVTFAIKSTASGQMPLSNTPSASDPSGNPVAVDGTDGAITVGPTQYNLTINITGGGTVNNFNANSPPFTPCSSASCTAAYDPGSVFTLRGSPAVTFSSWSGACTGSGDCSLVLSADTTVTAVFEPMVVVSGYTTPYQSLQTAYNWSASQNLSSAVLRARNLQFEENLSLNSPINIMIKGGYSDSGFQTVSGFSTLNGIVTLATGTMAVDNMIIK